jgi:hypothetical protein
MMSQKAEALTPSELPPYVLFQVQALEEATNDQPQSPDLSPLQASLEATFKLMRPHASFCCHIQASWPSSEARARHTTRRTRCRRKKMVPERERGGRWGGDGGTAGCCGVGFGHSTLLITEEKDTTRSIGTGGGGMLSAPSHGLGS